MGNRAVVTVEGSTIGVYLHWNGGRESVNAFLRVAKDLGVRDPIDDPAYFYARFIQIIGNFFGGTTSVGVEALSELDTDGDNGVFVVGANFKIIKGVESDSPDDEQPIYEAALKRNQALFKNRES